MKKIILFLFLAACTSAPKEENGNIDTILNGPPPPTVSEEQPIEVKRPKVPKKKVTVVKLPKKKAK